MASLSLTWQLQSDDVRQLLNEVERASEYGVGRIQLSHGAIHRIEDLWKNKHKKSEGAEDCLTLVLKVTEVAHKHNLKVDLWTHEISGASEIEITQWQGWKEIDDWLREKYQKAFRQVPGVNGLVLTLAETELCVYTDGMGKRDLVSVVPSLKLHKPEERMAHVIAVMHDICHIAGKILIVRSFVYEPKQLTEFINSLKLLEKERLQSDDLIFMSKCVPHDWHPYYPYSPEIGLLPNQLMELDSGGQEFTGQNQFMRDEVDYIRKTLSYGMEKRVAGVVVRVSRYQNSALGTPNELNLYAISSLIQKPLLTSQEIRLLWIKHKYHLDDKGDTTLKPASKLAGLIERTFLVTNFTLFPLNSWITNHSQLPSQNYVTSSLQNRKISKWVANPDSKVKEKLLDNPSNQTLVLIEEEKQIAKNHLRRSLEDLEEIRGPLGQDIYQDLLKYLCPDWVDVFRLFQLATFGMRYYRSISADRIEEKNAVKKSVFSWITQLRSFIDNPLIMNYFQKISSNVKNPRENFLNCCQEIEDLLNT